jgi:biotin transporter BioY
MPAGTRRFLVGFVLAGFVLGALTGFLLRPEAPLIRKQLPFSTVLTRGRDLKGLELILVPAAEQSFNRMLAGALIGAGAGLALGFLVRSARTS